MSAIKIIRGTPKHSVLIAVVLAALLLPLLLQSAGSAWVRILDITLLYVLLALGLNIVVGYAGLLDLGYVAFYAVGAYAFGLLASPHLTQHFPLLAAAFPQGLHLSFWVALPLCALLAALFGALLGLPTLKLRGDYLAIVTLGFGEIIRVFLNNLDTPLNLTNGPKGISGIDAPALFGLPFDAPLSIGALVLEPVTLYAYLFLLLTTLSTLFCRRLADSPVGRAWMAVREDERAAQALGIHTRNAKLLAFALGASLGGVSGCAFAAFQTFISPESFVLNESIMIAAMVVLGGMGHLPGVVLGAVLLAALPEVLRYVATPLREISGGHMDAAILRQILIALAMIGVMLLRPRGLWPAPLHGRAEPETP